MYWFDVWTGIGHPTRQWPEPVTYEEARKLIAKHPRHPGERHLELHQEPEELFQKYTVHNEAK